MSTVVRASTRKDLLGEGLCATKGSGFYWVDILGCLCHRLDFSGEQHTLTLPEMASKVLRADGSWIIFASESGLCRLNVSTEEWQLLAPGPAWQWGGTFRSNDGVYLGNGCYVYGRMRTTPQSGCGDLVWTNGKASRIIYQGFAIPNTFIWFADTRELLVSDSLEKKTYALQLDNDGNVAGAVQLWHDFSSRQGTPDGACLASTGLIYLAMWGEACILKLDRQGEILGRFELPALQPTSCQLREDERELMVTSATDGLAAEDLERYPLSGYLTRVSLEGGHDD